MKLIINLDTEKDLTFLVDLLDLVDSKNGYVRESVEDKELNKCLLKIAFK